MSVLHDLIWLIPLLPLLAAAINGLGGPRIGERAAGLVSVALVGVSFALACAVFVEVYTTPHSPGAVFQGTDYILYTWIGSGDFRINVGFYVDQLSSAMMLLVTGVGWLIHIYS